MRGAFVVGRAMDDGSALRAGRDLIIPSGTCLREAKADIWGEAGRRVQQGSVRCNC